MQIVWDEPKRLANLFKHGLDFAALDEEFFERAVFYQARAPRLRAIALQDERMITVIFTLLGSEAISVISMRPASVAERRLYDEEAI
jgi:uncharacterized DUF497 family protein